MAAYAHLVIELPAISVVRIEKDAVIVELEGGRQHSLGKGDSLRVTVEGELGHIERAGHSSRVEHNCRCCRPCERR